MHAKKKRYVLPEGRLEELTAPGKTYVITCAIDDCGCPHNSAWCLRGFFSLFLQVVYGIDFATRHHLPWYVDFANKIYPYTLNKTAPDNFWDAYFIQPYAPPARGSGVINRMLELYPIRIWNRKHARRINRVINGQLQPQPYLRKKIELLRHEFSGQNILGVQVRGTDHAVEVPPVPLERFWKTIDRERDHYDRLFLATDDKRMLEKFRQRYGGWLMYHPFIRSEGSETVHLREDKQDPIKLGEEVLLDCYALSFCRKAILIHSNISYCALLFNPTLKYILLEEPESRKKRLKTLAVYLLDQWKLRKF